MHWDEGWNVRDSSSFSKCLKQHRFVDPSRNSDTQLWTQLYLVVWTITSAWQQTTMHWDKGWNVGKNEINKKRTCRGYDNFTYLDAILILQSEHTLSEHQARTSILSGPLSLDHTESSGLQSMPWSTMYHDLPVIGKITDSIDRLLPNMGGYFTRERE